MRYTRIGGILIAGILLQQTAVAQMIRPGFEAGGAINFSTHNLAVTDINTKVSATSPGYRIGVPVAITLTKTLQLNTGIYYAAKGQSGDAAGGSPHLNYKDLELPVALTWNKANAEQNSFFAGIGPYIGYGISNHLSSSFGDGKLIWGNEIKRTDLGMQIQLGYEFRQGWLIRLLAQHSLGNRAASDYHNWMNTSADIRNKAHIALTLAYMFRLKR